ncbi:hypothetical protein HOF92_04145 [bacterium]|nr:hypothetical protein [bacterium]
MTKLRIQFNELPPRSGTATAQDLHKVSGGRGRTQTKPSDGLKHGLFRSDLPWREIFSERS